VSNATLTQPPDSGEKQQGAPASPRRKWQPPVFAEGAVTERLPGTLTGRLRSDVPESERASVLATVRGVLVTGSNFFRHLWSRNRLDKPTIQYPEQRRHYSNRFRGIHQLTKRPDGSLRCVACFMCATACPAECIIIEAGETMNKRVEKFPIRFDIDMLRCVFCGLCVDACPEEAIIMTQDYEMAAFTREETVYPISLLADRPQLASTPPGYRPRYEPGTDLVR
jgi:NADH-quinone oxidoreductase subunit I